MIVIVGLIVESIDLVRYLINRFFGKMGYFIVREVIVRGVDVILILGFINFFIL